MNQIHTLYLLLFAILLSSQSCLLKKTTLSENKVEEPIQRQTEPITRIESPIQKPIKKVDNAMQIAKEYENEYGKITILNKEGQKVVLISAPHTTSRGLMVNASTDGLSNIDCIVQFEKGKLFVKKASDNTNIEHFATRPFYVMNSKLAIDGNIMFSKGGATINGIYLKDYPDKSSKKGVNVAGTIKREAYPRSYYSTPESPQGMFADDGKIHYRLILEDYQISPLAKHIYEGTAMNQDGKAYFVWDMADSAIYLLDEAPLWTIAELNKKIKIEAIAITLENGSTLLCNWEIIK